jgi:hypothetical protein
MVKMASYHTSFTYKEKNSLDEGYIIASFEPDNGFMDSFLSMTNISDDYYDGTKKFNYGSRYDSSPEIKITIVKKNGSNMTVKDFRSCAKWLTGAKTDSWLDMYDGNTVVYSFLGKFLNMEQYKLDARTVGCRLTFSSVSPWAYSSEQVFDRSISQSLFMDGSVLVKEPVIEISVNSDGVLCNSVTPGVGACFCVNDEGVMYVDNLIVARIDNESDDLYSYIYLDIEFVNESCQYLQIENETLNEITRVDNIGAGDIIYITGKQFIVAYSRDQATGELVNQNRVFGEDFNFIWPRLMPGVNNFVIEGSGNGTVRFIYRYPMKIGDCTMDINTYGSDIVCGDCDHTSSYDSIRWKDIVDTPTTLDGYGITDAYTDYEVDKKIDGITAGMDTTIDENKLNELLGNILT